MTDELKRADNYINMAEQIPEDDFRTEWQLDGILNTNIAIALLLREILARLQPVPLPQGTTIHSTNCYRCGKLLHYGQCRSDLG